MDRQCRPALGAVHAIVQDGEGYLRIGAESGLLRFDGSRFTRWDRLSEFNMPAVPARSLHLARDGSLWVGFSQGAGIRMHPRRPVRGDDAWPRGGSVW